MAPSTFTLLAMLGTCGMVLASMMPSPSHNGATLNANCMAPCGAQRSGHCLTRYNGLCAALTGPRVFVSSDTAALNVDEAVRKAIGLFRVLNASQECNMAFDRLVCESALPQCVTAVGKQEVPQPVCRSTCETFQTQCNDTITMYLADIKDPTLSQLPQCDDVNGVSNTFPPWWFAAVAGEPVYPNSTQTVKLSRGNGVGATAVIHCFDSSASSNNTTNNSRSSRSSHNSNSNNMTTNNNNMTTTLVNTSNTCESVLSQRLGRIKAKKQRRGRKTHHPTKSGAGHRRIAPMGLCIAYGDVHYEGGTSDNPFHFRIDCVDSGWQAVANTPWGRVDGRYNRADSSGSFIDAMRIVTRFGTTLSFMPDFNWPGNTTLKTDGITVKTYNATEGFDHFAIVTGPGASELRFGCNSWSKNNQTSKVCMISLATIDLFGGICVVGCPGHETRIVVSPVTNTNPQPGGRRSGGSGGGIERHNTTFNGGTISIVKHDPQCDAAKLLPEFSTSCNYDAAVSGDTAFFVRQITLAERQYNQSIHFANLNG